MKLTIHFSSSLLICLLLVACNEAPGPTAASPPPVAAPAPPPPPPTLPTAPAELQLLAGDGHAGERDGAAAQARFIDPYGLAFDAQGALYVADGGDAQGAIRRIARDGTVSTLPLSAPLDTPSGLAIDAGGNLIVADSGAHRILRISPAGQVSSIAGTGKPGFREGREQAQFDTPMAVAVAADGAILVADAFNDRIRRIAPDGEVTTLAGGARPGYVDGPGEQARFDTPNGIAIDAAGNVWVADTRNDAVRRIAPDGEVTTVLRPDEKDDDADLRRPLALTLAPDGRIFIAVQARGRVLVLQPNGRLERLIEAEHARLSRPAALALDPERARLVISDAPAHRIHEIVATGRSTSRVVGPAPDAALPDTQGRWPLAPQRGWHEVVGTLGEVRAGRHNGRFEALHHLHAGLDVRGDVGEPVLAIAAGKVTHPLASAGFGSLGEALVIGDLTYVHMRVGRSVGGRALNQKSFQLLRNEKKRLERVRVRRGTRFAVGDLLGTINPMAHVHLQLGPPGAQRNPLVLGFTGFVDRIAPVLDAVGVRNGEVFAEGWDQVDDNLERRRLGLYALSWQLLDLAGRPLAGFETPREALRFDRLPPEEDAPKAVYVENSGISIQGRAATRFIYRLGVLPELPGGSYRLRVVGRDFSGNEVAKEIAFSL
ncbi:MAG TPA: SMP-30/gluconolactonase/LRE family protein [Burkholderiaceae bacterium]